MAPDPWIPKMRKPKKKNENPNPTSSTIGILSFEVASAMSRALHLHRSLFDAELPRLCARALSSPSLRALVSPTDSHLLSLALAEKLDDLNRVSAVAARLGHRCAHPALHAFDHVYADLLAGHLPDPTALGPLSKDAHSSFRRMDRLVASTSALYGEIESLADLEQSIKNLPEETRRQLGDKVRWRRNGVELLRDASLWNQSYDKVALLLARAVCSLHARIHHVFAELILGSGSNSGPIRSELGTNRGARPRRHFINCLTGSSEDHPESCSSRSGAIVLSPFGGEMGSSRFGPKSSLTSLAPPSTVGGAGFALHYANVIIVIEKFLHYPHLVGEEARDDLYQMLPSSLRMALRRSLKSYVKSMAIYDAPLAHNWKEGMENILSWLAPMAHSMIQWQTERNFEQQQIVFKASVLLLETLYFADREKIEVTICELLVGLNYLCRYEQQQSALLDCTSSLDFDDCMNWQLHS